MRCASSPGVIMSCPPPATMSGAFNSGSVPASVMRGMCLSISSTLIW
jgi:hypothetical protein